MSVITTIISEDHDNRLQLSKMGLQVLEEKKTSQQKPSLEPLFLVIESKWNEILYFRNAYVNTQQ